MSLPFVQLEYGTVKTTAIIKVFKCEDVVFLMSEKDYYPPSTLRNRSFGQRHRRSAHLLVFILDKDVLNGAQVYLGTRTPIPLKLHCVTLNF